MYIRNAVQGLGIFCILLMSTTSSAANLCDAPLVNRSFDRSNRQETSSIALTSRHQVCNEEYENEQRAESAAMSAGASGKYGMAKGSASFTRSGTTGRVHIKNSKFCTDSDSELSSFFSLSEEKQVASIAVAAWERCVSTTQTSQLFALFEQQKDKKGVTGYLIRSLSGQVGNIGEVKMIRTTPPDIKVQCTFDTLTMQANEPISYQITTPQTTFSCTKPKDASVQVSIITTQGSTKWMQLDSESEAKEYREDDIRKSISALQAQYNSLSTRELGKGEWPTGSYVILKGKNAACPAGFTERRAHLKAVNQFYDRERLASYVTPGEFGDSSIACHGPCGQYQPFLGDLVIAACVK